MNQENNHENFQYDFPFLQTTFQSQQYEFLSVTIIVIANVKSCLHKSRQLQLNVKLIPIQLSILYYYV